MDNSPEGTIEQIWQNLQDRYLDGFPIVKELIQNADDADATHLHIGWIRHLPGAEHILLQGPLLFLVNNGKFTDADARAINSMGLSSKAGDRFSIGKFGLGLKSIFHLCEAFFYSAKTDKERHGIVNPWADGKTGIDDFHQGWDEGSFCAKDRQLITTYLTNITEREHYLCLIIPLRQEEQLQGCTPIKDYFPDPDKPLPFFYEDIEIRMAYILPMLRSLTATKGWLQKEGDIFQLDNVFTIMLDHPYQRRRYRSGHQMVTDLYLPLTGHVKLNSSLNNRSGNYHFGGLEKYLSDDDIIKSLLASDKWRKRSILNRETKEREDFEDKADPHCAVYFTELSNCGDTDKLTISKAVFLPVDDVLLPERSGLILTLHGYYFLDPGRTEISNWDYTNFTGKPEDEQSLQKEWNGRLAQQGTLLLILPALEQFVKQADLSNERILSLTQTLKDSEPFKQYRTYICAEYQWVCCIRNGIESWQLLPVNRLVLEIPRSKSKDDPNRPFKALPTLKNIEEPFTYSDIPRLSLQDLATVWPEDLLSQVLEIPDVGNLFEHSVMMEYLVEFIKETAPPLGSTPTVAKRLIVLAQQGFRIRSLSQLAQNNQVKAQLRNFLNLVPKEQKLILDFGSQHSETADSVFAVLSELQLAILIIPSIFTEEGNQRQEHHISLECAYSILSRLAELQPQLVGFEDLRSEISLQVIKAIDADYKFELLRRCSDLKLFKGYNLNGNRFISLSLTDLRSLIDQKTLFTHMDDGGPGLSYLLQASLAEVYVVLITKKIASEVSEAFKIKISVCDVSACIETLTTIPRLSKIPKRGDLIASLLFGISANNHPAKKCIRYLLHSTPSEFDNIHTPLLVNRQRNDVWTKITREILSLIHADWRLLPEILASKLNDDHRQFLDVQEIDQTLAENLLRQVGAKRITLEFNQEECDLLLESIKDDELLKQLKIHAVVGSNRKLVAIDDNTYLASNFKLDDALLQHITVLRRNSKKMLAARQLELIAELSPTQAINIALNQLTPAQYYLVIMNAFEQIENPDDDLLSRLKKGKWLPTNLGVAVAPAQILYIPGLEDDIEQLLSSTQQEIVGVNQLTPDIRQHSVFSMDKMSKYIYPKANEALELLGQLMTENDRLHLGLIEVGHLTPEVLEDFVNLFDAEVLPTCTILRNVLTNVKSPGSGLNKLLQSLRCPLSPERMIKILNSLTERHQKARRNSERDLIFKIHLMYLQAAVAQDSFSEAILPHIQLLNRNNDWQSTTKLCFNIEGIAGNTLLNRDQENLIERVVRIDESGFGGPATTSSDGTGRSSQNLDKEFAQAAQKLDTYFKIWARYIDPEIIGGFLCILGDQPELKEKAARYLNKRTIQETRKLFKWPDIDKTMERWRYAIDIVPANVKTQTVISLVGQPFEAPLRTDLEMETLFVEGQQRLSITRIGYYKQQFQHYRLCLREIDTASLPPKKLSELLRNSTQKLFGVFYDQPNIDLSVVWDNLDKSEQLDIGVAQNLLLNSAFFYLRPFGIHTHRDIKPIFNQWEEARHREAELRHNHAGADDQSLYRILFESKRKKEDAEEKLKKLLVVNEEVQALILEALRKKINQFTYKPQSIPFEIFQNADDAILQLEKMLGVTELSDVHTRFVVGIDGQLLYFMHWGRPINDFQRGSFDKGRELGYDRDLEKMLVLSYSDKSVEIDTGSVTGKFGLGFKSIFLASDSPQVVSGRLDFRVVGGIYPERLGSEEVDRLNTLLGDSKQNKGTVIVLPVLPSMDIQQDILQNFSELVHILLIFSRRIKRYELDRQNRIVTWKENQLPNVDNVFIGDIQPAGKKGLVFRSEPVISGETIYGSAVLLQVGPNGVHPLPDSIPPVWVTAPTKRVAGFGFAINSLFDIDVGRAQLDITSPRNIEIVQAMGSNLGTALCNLYDASATANWVNFQKSLGVTDVMPYDFWYSLWGLLGNTFNEKSRGSELRELLHLLLWGTLKSPGGMTWLLTNRPALPSGLDFDAYQCLVKIQPNEVLLIAKGELEKEETFTSVSTWPLIAGQLSPGRIISSRIHRTLEALLPNQLKFEDYKLHRAIGEVIPANGQISPELAAQLGKLITKEFLSKLDTNERDEVLKQFEVNQVEFLGQEKNYHPARELLVAMATTDDMSDDEKRAAQDEQLRAQFAPVTRLLSAAYTGLALDFFKACRLRLEADAKTMTPWAISATTKEKRLGVLQYLLRGRLRLELAENLKSEINGTWLESLTDDRLRNEFGFIDVNQRSMILALLGLLREQEAEDGPGPEPVRQTVQSVLYQIYEWWHEEKISLIQEYEQDTFPGWYSPQALNHGVFSGDLQSRQTWLALFMLGSSHTMGYFSPQSHRNFLNLCHSNGWWNIFSNPDATAKDWIEILDEYLEYKIEEEISYQHWIKQFVYIYQIATRLPEYAGAFLEINKLSRRFNLTEFTRLKSSALFGQGSYTASRIDRTLGGGACFVIRELVRNRVISSKDAYKHCYTPIKRVRDCFVELRCDGLEEKPHVNNSRIMYQFLSEHLGDERKVTFDYSFDLPFLMITKRWGTVKGFLAYYHIV